MNLENRGQFELDEKEGRNGWKVRCELEEGS